MTCELQSRTFNLHAVNSKPRHNSSRKLLSPTRAISDALLEKARGEKLGSLMPARASATWSTRPGSGAASLEFMWLAGSSSSAQATLPKPFYIRVYGSMYVNVIVMLPRSLLPTAAMADCNSALWRPCAIRESVQEPEMWHLFASIELQSADGRST